MSVHGDRVKAATRAWNAGRHGTTTACAAGSENPSGDAQSGLPRMLSSPPSTPSMPGSRGGIRVPKGGLQEKKIGRACRLREVEAPWQPGPGDRVARDATWTGSMKRTPGFDSALFHLGFRRRILDVTLEPRDLLREHVLVRFQRGVAMRLVREHHQARRPTVAADRLVEEL